METPQWAGYYHIYLIIVWRIHSGRVIIIFTLLLYGDSTVGGLLSYLPNYSMETPQDDGLLSYLPNYSMKTPQWAGYYHIYLIIVWKPHRGGLLLYLPNYSMETPQWAGYYHIYLIIVWKPHRVTGYGDPTVGGLLSYLPNIYLIIIVWRPHSGRVIIIFT